MFFIGGAVVTFVGGFGYALNIIGKEKVKTSSFQQRWNAADNKVRELSKQLGDSNTTKKRIEGLHLTAKDELAFYKREHDRLAEDYEQLKQEFQQLADEHNGLKETYAPLAALNPFERQAVEAVTNQSTLDEWMNGPREVK